MHADILIVGGGPSGLSLAASLGTSGFRVLVIERGPARQARFDGRTLALSYRSMEVLRKAGVAPLLLKTACPILSIRVADQQSTAHLNFRANEVGDHPFGWIVEHHLFHHALSARIKTLETVRVVSKSSIEEITFGATTVSVKLENGGTHTASLCVAADGRSSATRDAAGISCYGWDYPQAAIACVIGHEGDHDHCAVEHFGAGGPFAALPMTKGRSSIIWTETRLRASALMKMSDSAFRTRLEDKVRRYLGHLRVVGPRFSYPLALQHARRYIGPRLALIGDAAHSIHPIAGQGFNLGMGDIEALGTLLCDAAQLGLDPGAADLLELYEKRRKVENGNMVLMTDSLTRLFSNDLPGVTQLRRFGLRAVEAMPPLKRFFMRTAMGLRSVS